MIEVSFQYLLLKLLYIFLIRQIYQRKDEHGIRIRSQA